MNNRASNSRFQIVVDSPKALLDFDKKKLRRVMRQAGAEVSARTKELMRAAVGNGRTYRGSGGSKQYRGYKKGHYTASSPGNAPVQVTKTLIRSIKVLPFKSGMGVAVRMTMFYARFLEAGAQGGMPGNQGQGSGKRNTYKRQKINEHETRYVRTALVGKRILLPRPSLTVALTAKQGSLGDRIIAAVQDGIAFKKQK